METIDSKRADRKTVLHLIKELKNTDAHAGQLLAQFGDVEGYDDIIFFNEQIRKVLRKLFLEVHGEEL